jgi:uncharacterized membrane protein
MKTLYLVGIFLFLNLSLFSQTNEIDQLDRLRGKLIEQTKVIADSIKNIDMQINFLKMKNKKKELGSAIAITSTNSEAKIQSEPEIQSEIVGYISKDEELKVFDLMNGYWLIEKGSLTGYVSDVYLNENAEMTNRKRIDEKDRITKKYGEEIADKIFKKSLWIGMTIEMARLSIGNHQNLNSKRKSKSGNERWMYKNKYLNFEDGKLVSWENPQKSIKSKLWN